MFLSKKYLSPFLNISANLQIPENLLAHFGTLYVFHIIQEFQPNKFSVLFVYLLVLPNIFLRLL